MSLDKPRPVFGYTVSFSPEQRDVLWLLTHGRQPPQSFSQLIERAFAEYIPDAYLDEKGNRMVWPKAERVLRRRLTPRRSPIYGMQFSAEQDRVIRGILRRDVRFSELVEAALADHVLRHYNLSWPPTRRLSKSA